MDDADDMTDRIAERDPNELRRMAYALADSVLEQLSAAPWDVALLAAKYLRERLPSYQFTWAHHLNRDADVGWAGVGKILGITRQAAFERFVTRANTVTRQKQ